MPIHPEGEEAKPDPVGSLKCPNCQAVINTPELANVEAFVCPKCGERIELPRS